MRADRIRSAFLATVVLTGAVVGGGAAASAAEPPTNLNGEVLSQLAFPLAETDCQWTGTAVQATFTVTGDASGPYPGTFTETGTYTFGNNPAAISGPIPTFHTDFTITSPLGSVTGTTDDVMPYGSTGTCDLPGPDPALGYLAFTPVQASYRATITTGTGRTYVDRGGSTLTAGAGSGSTVIPGPFSQTFGSSTGGVDPGADLTMTPPADVTATATSPAGATVTYPLPTVSDEGPATPPTPTCTPASGTVFVLGTTTVTCTATDPQDANSPVQTSFTVTVVSPPTSLDGETLLHLAFPLAETDCQQISAGTWQAAFTVTGDAGGPYPGTFTETGTYTLFGDFTSPTGRIATFHTDFTITSAVGTVSGTTDDAGGPISTGTCGLFGPDPNQDYLAFQPVISTYRATITTGTGRTYVDRGGSTLTAGTGNSSTVLPAPFSETFGSSTGGVDPGADLAMDPPADITATASSPAGATVTYPLPTVSDEGPATPPTPTCTPASGTVFALGTTTVTCTATDALDANSPVQTGFTVTVVSPSTSLDGETLSHLAFPLAETDCQQISAGTWQAGFTVTGDAGGPYPGTFTETGTYTFFGDFTSPTGPITAFFHTDFTITSALGTVTGTTDFAGGPISTGTCGLFGPDPNGYLAFQPVISTYRATITTGTGTTYVDRGGSILTAGTGNSSTVLPAPFSQTFGSNPAARQPVTIAPVPSQVYGSTPFTVTATGGPGDAPVTLTAGPAQVCTLGAVTAGTDGQGNRNATAPVSIAGAGTCTIAAAQAASSDGAYAAGSDSLDVAIGKAAQVLTFTNAPPATPTYGGTWTPSFGGGGSTASPVLGVESNSTGCVRDGGTVRFSGVGNCTVTLDQAGDANHLAAPQISTQFTVGQASTAVTSTTPLSVAVGTPLVPSATLDSPAAACRPGQAVVFSLDRNPVTGAVGGYPLGTATTDATGAARAPAVSTTGWQPNPYLMTATFAGTATCSGSTTTAPLSISSPGQVAGGVGSYAMPVGGPVAFGFAVTRLPRTGTPVYVGALTFVQEGRWSYLGSITGYVKSSAASATITGTGTLSWWNPALNHNRGGWAVARTGVPFSARFTPTTTTAPGSFGVRLTYTPAPPQPAVLPNSDPVALSRGAIAMQ